MTRERRTAPLRVLGLVLARGGSKGVPRKNIHLLAGQPLIAYTARAAIAATRLSRIVVSTDDPEIAKVAERWLLEVPFLRPPELARDDTPSLPVVQHALACLEAEGDRYDAVCQLQPTSPLRRLGEIDASIAMLEQSGADSVMTVSRVPDEYNPHWVYFRGPDGALRLSTGEATPLPRRQALPAAFHRDGSVYVTRRDVVMNQNTLYGSRVLGLVVDGERVNIDRLEDFEKAEAILRRCAADRHHPVAGLAGIGERPCAE
jgi:CMP-N-acetylneuraminic acid synthetase